MAQELLPSLGLSCPKPARLPLPAGPEPTKVSFALQKASTEMGHRELEIKREKTKACKIPKKA